jgi:hypothetical protein
MFQHHVGQDFAASQQFKDAREIILSLLKAPAGNRLPTHHTVLAGQAK